MTHFSGCEVLLKISASRTTLPPTSSPHITREDSFQYRYVFLDTGSTKGWPSIAHRPSSNGPETYAYGPSGFGACARYSFRSAV